MPTSSIGTVEDAGRRDDPSHPPERLSRLRDRGGDCGVVGHVDRECERAPAVGLDELHGLARVRLVPVDDRDGRTLLRRELRRRAPDTAPSTSDEHHCILEHVGQAIWPTQGDSP